MRLLHIYPKPGERLEDQRAGDAVRALALTTALAGTGIEVIRAEGSSDSSAATAAKTYKSIFRNVLPKRLALAMRDVLRVSFTRRLGRQMAEQFKDAGINAVIETHDPLSMAGLEAASRLNVPLILDDASPLFEAATMAGIGLSQVHESTFRSVTAQADLIVAVNKTMQSQLVLSGASQRKLAVIENGVDLGLFEAARMRHVRDITDNEVTKFIFAGSFQPYHRTPFLIEAFAATQRPTSQLLMVGDGRELGLCSEMVERLGLGARVQFLGRVPNERIPEILAQGDVGILPATNDYGNPMKLYEYLAAGLPIIAPDQETVREVVGDDMGTALFEPDNAIQLTLAIDRLANDATLRKRMSSASVMLAERHTWQKRAEKLAGMIINLIQEKSESDRRELNAAC